jgi:hypothetical protein
MWPGDPRRQRLAPAVDALGRPILILGVPRSGTTWVKLVLGAAPGVRVAHEPDNETNMPWALIAKASLGRFPRLAAGEAAPRAYEALWREALVGKGYPRRALLARECQQRLRSFDYAEAACDPRRRVPPSGSALALAAIPLPNPRPRRRALVKSVHAALCGEWLLERFAPLTVVVRRDPVEVVASWRSMGDRRDGSSDRLEYAGRPERILAPAALRHLRRRYGDPPRSPRDALTWLAGSLIRELDELAARRPEVIVLDFDGACRDPSGALGELAGKLGLPFGEGCRWMLAALERDGSGWQPMRETRQVPGAWRKLLPAAQTAAIEAGLERFGLASPAGTSAQGR